MSQAPTNSRRDFFRKLAIGAAALPAVVKVAMEGQPKFPFLSCEEYLRGVMDPANDNADTCWISTYSVDENGLIYMVDSYPLRFST